MNTLETLREAVRRIEELNLEPRGAPIPLSDEIYRRHMSDLAETEDQLLFHLRLLTDSHFIFSIRVAEPDEAKGLPGVYGYVVADTAILHPLLAEYQHRLEQAYQSQTGKQKGAASITRELMANVREHSATPLGKVLHICVMLQQFLHLMADKPEEYSAYWREVQLRQLLPELGALEPQGVEIEEEKDRESDEAGSPFRETGARSTRRAVDTLEYREAATMDLSGAWGKAVEKYGVTFLLRVHLRRHDFETLKRLVIRKRIAREEDLRYLRDSLRLMDDRYTLDREMAIHLPALRDLKRLAQLRLNQFTLIRKKYEDDLDV